MQARNEFGEEDRENFNPNQSQLTSAPTSSHQGVNLEINGQNANS